MAGRSIILMLFVLLVSNANAQDSTVVFDSLYAQELQAAHMASIGRLAEEGKLVLAGPFLDNGHLRGIYIFAVESI